MRFFILTLTLGFSSALLPAQEVEEAIEEKQELSPEERKARVSLALGYQAGLRARQKQIRQADVTSADFLKGYQLALEGKELEFTPEELREAFAFLQKEITERESALAKRNLESQKAFFAENGKIDGVVTLKSGLQYQELASGGEQIEAEEVRVHYRGTLADGTEFDASDGERPAQLKLDNVIPGFREALKLIPVGARWKVFIPSDLGYGQERRSHLIGPNELLIYEVELVSVVAKVEE